VVDDLIARGWRVVARNIGVGRDEIDIVAVEPGTHDSLVFVEVRSHSTSQFGTPEESVVGRKVQRMYRAAMELVRVGTLPDGAILPNLTWRVDLASVAVANGLLTVRYLRGLSPG
jgi:putative endonuclease